MKNDIALFENSEVLCKIKLNLLLELKLQRQTRSVGLKYDKLNLQRCFRKNIIHPDNIHHN